MAESTDNLPELNPDEFCRHTPFPAVVNPRAIETVEFLERLRVPGGSTVGQPWRVHEFQRRFLEMSLADNVRTALLSIPRKNGKTALCSGLVLAALCGPLAIENGEIVSAARSRDQASIVFRFLLKLISLAGWEQFFKIRESEKLIECVATGTTYRAISSDAKNAHGGSPFLFIVDELGQQRHERDELLEALETATGAHENALGLIISTQAPDDRAVFSRRLDAALSGENPQTVALVYSAPVDADPLDPRVWALANPGIGAFRGDGDIRNTAATAAQIPASMRAFRNLHLNQRISLNEHWIEREDWERCAGLVDDAAFAGPVWGGLDLSSSRDLTSLVLVARDDDENIHARAFFWLPDDAIDERERRDVAEWRLWSDQNFIDLCPGRVVDYDFVAARLAEICGSLDVRSVAYDRWHIEHLRQRLGSIGAEHAVPLSPHGQGFRDMTPALEETENAIVAGTLRHGGNPVLRYCVRNAIVSADPGGNRKLNKSRATGRIDGAVALAMAVHEMTGKNDETGLIDRTGMLVL